MYRVLIVEDDRGISAAIEEQAAQWNLVPRTVQNFRMVMEEFEVFQPHLVLMDITLPHLNGFHWCSQIRRVSKVPILFISSAADNMNTVMAMNMGADDMIAKPFDSRVLMAKIQAMLRRSYDFGGFSLPINQRGAVLHTDSQCLAYEGQEIVLTRNEYRILLCLMERTGQVVSRETLMERLWETDSFVDENTLTVNVGRLRRKLDAAGLEGFITTRFGVGYMVE